MIQTFYSLQPLRHLGRRQGTTVRKRHLSTKLPEVKFESSSPSDEQLSDAYRPFYEQNQPVIFRGVLSQSVAVDKWTDLDYLSERVDPEYVCDVEAGAYNKGEKLSISFDQYVEYIRLWKSMYKEGEVTPEEHLLYLAQNDLPAGLLADVPIPKVCSDPSFGAGKLYNTMLWMGPAATLSPLHYDPMDNFLMQIVGRKQVVLLSKETDSSTLYTGENHGQQYNTSAVDVNSPDLDKFPLFKDTQKKVSSGSLFPGDMLYIPAKWWHSVKSLDYSISVNAWWR